MLVKMAGFCFKTKLNGAKTNFFTFLTSNQVITRYVLYIERSVMMSDDELL